MGVASLRADR